MTATMTHPETARFYALYLNPDKKTVTVVLSHTDGEQELVDALGRTVIIDRQTIVSVEKNQKAGYALVEKLNRDLSISRYGM